MKIQAKFQLQRGQTLIMLLLFMVISVIITSASVVLFLVNSRASDTLVQGTTALDVAESGAETAMIKLLRDPNYAGETLTVGDGSAIVTVTGINTKTIISQGTLNNASRKIQVIADYTNNVLTVTSWKEIF